MKEAGFGYETSVIHPMTITPPATLTPGQKVTLSGKAGWLMCDPNTCVPGKADLSITLEVGAAAAPSPEATAIEAAVAKLPSPVAAPMKTALEGANVVLTATIPRDRSRGRETRLYLLKPGSRSLHRPTVTVAGETVTISGPNTSPSPPRPPSSPESSRSRCRGKRPASSFPRAASPRPRLPRRPNPPNLGRSAKTPEPKSSSAPPRGTPFGGGLFGVLLAAFLGGIILNVMPCVFPVISLKVMSFVGQAGEDRKKVFAHSAVFALGILVFFWALTIMMLVIKSASGGEVGWGAQLQFPVSSSDSSSSWFSSR